MDSQRATEVMQDFDRFDRTLEKERGDLPYEVQGSENGEAVYAVFPEGINPYQFIRLQEIAYGCRVRVEGMEEPGVVGVVIF